LSIAVMACAVYRTGISGLDDVQSISIPTLILIISQTIGY